MRSVAVGSLMALLVGAGLAQGQPPVRQASGGIGREAMYLRLFQEIANFEAEADALEATGVQPTELRSYHQKRLGLSEAHAVLLKQTALDCIRDLRSSGMLAQRGGTRPLVPTAETVRAGMARVSAAVESLRAAMGPANFAYVDSLIRGHVLATRSPVASAMAVVGAARISASILSYGSRASDVHRFDAGGSCEGGTSCPVPTSEVSAPAATPPPNWCGTCVGGIFTVHLLDAGGATPSANEYTGRSITESFPNGSQDTCWFPNSTEDKIVDAPPPGPPWPVNSSNGYCCDLIGIDPAWASYYQGVINGHRPPYQSCYVNVPQQMNIDTCGGNPATTKYGSVHDTKDIINATEMTATRDTAVPISGPIEWGNQ